MLCSLVSTALVATAASAPGLSFSLEVYQLSRAIRVREESKHIHCAESIVPKLLRFLHELHVQTDNLAVASSDTMVPVERALAR